MKGWFDWCFVSLLVHVACGQVRPAADLQEALQTLGLTKFLQKLKEAGFSGTLYNRERYTLFAPTNEAFARLEARMVHSPSGALTPDVLTRILSYHIAYSDWRSNDWTNEELIPTALTGMNIRVNIYEHKHGRKGDEKSITLCGVPLLSSNNKAGNGIVHVLNDVIYPMAAASAYDTLASLDGLKHFKTLLDSGNLMRTLKYQEPLTIFAPVDAAFKKLPPQYMENLSSQLTAMAAILNYHVVNGTYYTASMYRNMRLHTMESSDITVAEEPNESNGHTAKLNGDARILASYPTTNGVLHVVDTLLLPPAHPKQMYYAAKEGLQYDPQREAFRRK